MGNLKTKLGIVCLGLIVAVTTAQVPGYTPYSWVPAMGYSLSTCPAVISAGGIVNHTATVSDQDEYMRTATNAVVQLCNSAKDVIATQIASGTRLGAVSNNFSSSQCVRTRGWTIRLQTPPPNTYVVAVDKFKAVDTGNMPQLLDEDGDEMSVTLVIHGPTQGGPGGGGGS